MYYYEFNGDNYEFSPDYDLWLKGLATIVLRGTDVEITDDNVQITAKVIDWEFTDLNKIEEQYKDELHDYFEEAAGKKYAEEVGLI